MSKKNWQAVEVALYLSAMIGILSYALAGLITTPGFHQ